MLGKKMRILLALAVLLVFFSAYASAAYNMYWLRGEDAKTTISGEDAYLFISTPPNQTSSETVFDLNTEAGIHEWASWHSSQFPQEVMLSGKAYLWFSGLGVSNDVVAYRWTLSDFGPGGNSDSVIVRSGWIDILASGESVSEAMLASYRISAGHRLKLLVEYTANRGSGNLMLSVDKPAAGSTAEWKAPNGITYKAYGVAETGGILVNLCGLPIGCYSNSDCDDGEILTKDVCVNAGLCEAYCESAWCDTECLNNADCDDGTATTLDTCRNSGTCNAECVHEVCTVGCYKNSDCDDADALTTDTCLKPGTCDASCSYFACDTACSTNSDCDDGSADTADLCVGAGTCDAECRNLAACGNGACDEGESMCSCPNDCGSCSGTAPGGLCRENVCRGADCTTKLKENCCGNFTCEDAEDYVSCSLDCKPQNLIISVLDANAGTYFMRGELLAIRARITADSHEVTTAEVSAKGFFGKIRLFNDGTHRDNSAGDNVYGNYFYVNESTAEGNYPVFIEAKFKENTVIKKQNYLVIPKLEMALAADRDAYSIGDIIKISGVLKKRNRPVRVAVDVNIAASGKLIFEERLFPDGAGIFETAYHSSFLDPVGDWAISAYSADANNNYAVVTKGVSVVLPSSEEKLDINVTRPLGGSFLRGESVQVAVRVMDSSRNDINGASVSVVCPGEISTALEENMFATYSGRCLLEWDAALGSNTFRVTATKTDGNVSYSGSGTFDANVNAASLSVEILEPRTVHFSAGEEVAVLARITYPDGAAVTSASLNASVNGKEITMRAVESGVYRGVYFVDITDGGKIGISIMPEDPYGNSGIGNYEIEVSGVSYLYYLRAYAWAIVVLGVVGGVGIAAAAVFAGKKKSISYLEARKSELERVIKDVQQQYFKGIVDRKTYIDLISRYEMELSDAKKSLEIAREKKPGEVKK